MAARPTRPVVLCLLATVAGTLGAQETPPVRTYTAVRASTVPILDGRLDDPAWQSASWSARFVDIEGARKPSPRLATRVKLLWDDRYLYVAAELAEPDLWATFTTRDTVIYFENDFEVFIDPDGDRLRYVELEVNALGTVWDLFLPRPYRDGGSAVNGYDMVGLQVAVGLDGTLNDPSDRDRGWTVEMALPWTALGDSGRTAVPPADGARWRINFSRVQWDRDTVDGRYRKRIDPATGKPFPEHNWVWSPQGQIDMHLPERWGIVTFRGKAAP